MLKQLFKMPHSTVTINDSKVFRNNRTKLDSKELCDSGAISRYTWKRKCRNLEIDVAVEIEVTVRENECTGNSACKAVYSVCTSLQREKEHLAKKCSEVKGTGWDGLSEARDVPNSDLAA